MQLRQVLVFESDGRLAALLRPLAEARSWALREPRDLEACVRLLDRGESPVLVLGVGVNVEMDFDLLDAVSRACPHAAILVVMGSDNPTLLGLAWDLGAAYVLAPPHGRDLLLELVPALLGEPEGGA
jgi:hypothetical protein